MDQINGSVRDSAWAPEFDMKRVKKAEVSISRNIMSVRIEMRSVARIFSAITIIELHLRNSDE